jgi:hypothetical protein
MKMDAAGEIAKAVRPRLAAGNGLTFDELTSALAAPPGLKKRDLFMILRASHGKVRRASLREVFPLVPVRSSQVASMPTSSTDTKDSRLMEPMAGGDEGKGSGTLHIVKSVFRSLSLRTQLLFILLFLLLISIGSLTIIYTRAEEALLEKVGEISTTSRGAIQISVEELTYRGDSTARLKSYGTCSTRRGSRRSPSSARSRRSSPAQTRGRSAPPRN